VLNLGLAEMAVVAVAALLVVRPAELPGLARTAGRLVGRLRALRHLIGRQFEDMAQGAEVSAVEMAHRQALAGARATPETIITPRLTLRPPTMADAPAMQALFGRWEVIRWMGPQTPWPYPPDGAETYLRDTLLPQMARGEAMGLALSLSPPFQGGGWGGSRATALETPPPSPPLSEGGEAIGLITFKKDTGADRWEAGFWLGEPHWGQGYMTEALAAACAHFRLAHPGAKVYATCDPANRASARVQDKAGFVYQETFTRARPARNGSTEAELRALPLVGEGGRYGA
jgi:[ribosomal protein S5]-alanine N-acetyltransferase